MSFIPRTTTVIRLMDLLSLNVSTAKRCHLGGSVFANGRPKEEACVWSGHLLTTTTTALYYLRGFVTKSYGTALKNTKSYLVDPASSHMLVSKIKPCMSKYKHLYTVKLRTAHYISNYLFDG
jgi:hypothetical protein